MEADTIVYTLYGCQAYLYNCPAYCRRKGKYMTAKMIRGKGCLGKQCPYLDKKEHQYWVMRESIKAKKKTKKEA